MGLNVLLFYSLMVIMMNFDKNAVKLYIKELASNHRQQLNEKYKDKVLEIETKALEIADVTPEIYEENKKNGKSIAYGHKYWAAAVLGLAIGGKDFAIGKDKSKICNYHNDNYIFRHDFGGDGYFSYLTLRKIARSIFRKLKTIEINNGTISSIF